MAVLWNNEGVDKAAEEFFTVLVWKFLATTGKKNDKAFVCHSMFRIIK